MACPPDRLISAMEKASGKPSLTTAGAILKALKTLGVKRIAMATPYTDVTNEKECGFMERHGFEVTAIKGLGMGGSLQKIQKISRVRSSEIQQHAKSVDSQKADALLICCTDFGSADVVETLEDELGKPVREPTFLDKAVPFLKEKVMPYATPFTGQRSQTPLPATPAVDARQFAQAPQNITQTGLTHTENALLSNSEKAMRLKQRGQA